MQAQKSENYQINSNSSLLGCLSSEFCLEFFESHASFIVGRHIFNQYMRHELTVLQADQFSGLGPSAHPVKLLAEVNMDDNGIGGKINDFLYRRRISAGSGVPDLLDLDTTNDVSGRDGELFGH